MMTLYQEVEERLRAHQIKLTSQRRYVIHKLLSVRRHVSAEQLVDLLKKDKVQVSRATIYRLLEVLKQSKVIDVHDFDQRRRVYEPSVGKIHHDHLYCISCERIIEFHNDGIERLQNKVLKKHRFMEVYHSHKIFGYCHACHSRQRAKRQ